MLKRVGRGGGRERDYKRRKRVEDETGRERQRQTNKRVQSLKKNKYNSTYILIEVNTFVKMIYYITLEETSTTILFFPILSKNGKN